MTVIGKWIDWGCTYWYNAVTNLFLHFPINCTSSWWYCFPGKYTARKIAPTLFLRFHVFLRGITENIIITHRVTGRSIMLSRHNAHLIDGTSECFKKLWTLFVLYQFVVEIPVLPEIRAGALRPCNETYRKNRKTDMRDSDICILQLRLAVIWNIENITDMQNVEGKWSVESL